MNETATMLSVIHHSNWWIVFVAALIGAIIGFFNSGEAAFPNKLKGAIFGAVVSCLILLAPYFRAKALTLSLKQKLCAWL